MPKSSVNASLSSYDDIFSTEESRQEEQREQVQQIPIGELFPFKNHPFKVLDDDSMSDTVESVKQYGVLSPLIARPRPKGGYEIISGHRRQHAAELAGLETLPVIVRQMDDDAAIILMVDSNLQREHILPSERAFVYKMKLDAMKNQGTRSDLTSTQVVSKLRSNEKLGAENAIRTDNYSISLVGKKVTIASAAMAITLVSNYIPTTGAEDIIKKAIVVVAGAVGAGVACLPDYLYVTSVLSMHKSVGKIYYVYENDYYLDLINLNLLDIGHLDTVQDIKEGSYEKSRF